MKKHISHLILLAGLFALCWCLLPAAPERPGEDPWSDEVLW